MNTLSYKIESSSPIVASLHRTQVRDGALLASRELAVALAAKSITHPPGGVVRVVHVPTGEVLFSKVSGWGELDE
ncbi:MAG: hypothetical protein Q8R72_11560 [Hylemonella sp.]|nr:hypothetical protein [Hylemonella sp.]